MTPARAMAVPKKPLKHLAKTPIKYYENLRGMCNTITKCLHICIRNFWQKIAYNRMCILLLPPYVDTVKTNVNAI